MSERAAAASAVTLPERVTVSTCIACGSMGREERCDGDCSEHKLVLVSAADYDELLRAAHASQARAEGLGSVVCELAGAEAKPSDPCDALLTLRDSARRALRKGGDEEDGTDWASPGTVTGWWCARCGNVDMPKPCIGVCVWRPADWVSLALYQRQLGLADPSLRAARYLRRLLARVAAVTPRAGQWQRNWEALAIAGPQSAPGLRPGSARSRGGARRRLTSGPRPGHARASRAPLTLAPGRAWGRERPPHSAAGRDFAWRGCGWGDANAAEHDQARDADEGHEDEAERVAAGGGFDARARSASRASV